MLFIELPTGTSVLSQPTLPRKLSNMALIPSASRLSSTSSHTFSSLNSQINSQEPPTLAPDAELELAVDRVWFRSSGWEINGQLGPRISLTLIQEDGERSVGSYR